MQGFDGEDKEESPVNGGHRSLQLNALTRAKLNTLKATCFCIMVVFLCCKLLEGRAHSNYLSCIHTAKIVQNLVFE